MSRLSLGNIVGTRCRLAMNDEQRKTHMHVIGSTGTGKSKFLEHLQRQDIDNGRGFCLIDPHGELAQNILSYVSTLLVPPKRFYYIAPHRDDWTVCYNPLVRRGEDEYFLVTALKNAVVKCWGADSTQETPRLDEWLRTAFVTAVTLGLTLPEIGLLLEPNIERNNQRRAVIERLPENLTRIRDAWAQLCLLSEKKKPIDFEATVGSTTRRLAAFLDNPRLNRIFGVPDISLDLISCMDEGAIIVVDLAIKGRLHPEDARLFGTLLLTDFFVQMQNRQRPERPFTLYIDEFQNFATKDIARMLAEARKFGLELVLAHQRPGQLLNSDSAEERDLWSAVMQTARTKVVFGGIAPDELEDIAKLLSSGELDPYKVKKEIKTRSVLNYRKEYWRSHSKGHAYGYTTGSGGGSTHGTSIGSVSTQTRGAVYGDGSGLASTPLHTNESSSWASHFASSDVYSESWMDAETTTESESTTTFPVLVPEMGEQLSSVYYETLEEQLYQFMAVLTAQQQRQAMVRVVGQNESLPIEVPFVSTVEPSRRQLERQLEDCAQAACFLPVSEATKLVERRQKEFLALGKRKIIQPDVDRATIEIQPTMPQQKSPTTESIRVGNVELQPRDFALLKDVFNSRFITIAHAAKLHFGDMKSAEASAKRRLAKLADKNCGLLKRQEVNLKRCRVIYRLTKNSVDLLVKCRAIGPRAGEEWDSKVRKRYTDRIATSTLEHEIGMLDIKAALQPALEEHAHLKVHEFGVWPYPYQFQVQRQGRHVMQQPDGFIHVLEFSPNLDEPRSHYFYIELDRGTETLDRIVEKVEGYMYHLRSKGFAAWLGFPSAKPGEHPFRVLFVVNAKASDQRRANIAQRLTEASIKTFAPIATLADLLRDPLGHIWVTPSAYAAWLQTDGKAPLATIPLFEDLSTGPVRSP